MKTLKVYNRRVWPRLHNTGTISNLGENRKCQHVHMRPVRKSPVRIVIVLLLQQVHCQKPPVYTAFLFFSTKSEQTAIHQSHIINPLLTSFAQSVRESIAFGFYRTDLAPSSLGLYENLRQYFPVQTSHSVNKSLIHDCAFPSFNSLTKH